MTARIFELAYQLRLHRVGGWALDRWAVTLAWGASVLDLDAVGVARAARPRRPGTGWSWRYCFWAGPR